MKYPYDARTPIRPGIVSGMPRPRVFGLTPGQLKAARTTNPTTPHHRRGGPFGLGMPSTARISHSAFASIPTKPVYRERTPGRKRSIGTSSKRPGNPIFQPRILSVIELDLRVAGSRLDELRQMYHHLQIDMEASEHSYECKRAHFLKLWPRLRNKLDQMEAAVRAFGANALS